MEVDTKPLCRGRKISWDGQGNDWVAFMYERLQIFVTSAAKFCMMIKIVFYGLVVKDLYS